MDGERRVRFCAFGHSFACFSVVFCYSGLIVDKKRMALVEVSDLHKVEQTNLVISRRGSQRSKHPFQDRVLQRVGSEVYATTESRPKSPRLKGIFTVCDGHGKPGHHAAEWFSKDLTDKVENALLQFETVQTDLSKMKQCIVDAFLKSDADFYRYVMSADHLHKHDGGSTASVVVVWDTTIFAATVGDSRIMIFGSEGPMVLPRARVVFESQDHDIDVNNADTRRAIRAGGEVVAGGSYIAIREGSQAELENNEELFPQHTMLNMSRSMGNFAFKAVPDKPVISPTPDVHVVDVRDFKFVFLILASDGMWKHLSDSNDPHVHREKVNEILYQYLGKDGSLDCEGMADAIADLCRAPQNGKNTSKGLYYDDFSILVSEAKINRLHPSSPSSPSSSSQACPM
eukprot:ANDGO_06955.mRNA.1 putative protein phosphatase 2C 52